MIGALPRLGMALRVDRRGLSIDGSLASIVLFLAWVATSALLPVAPWNAGHTWRAEADAVRAAMETVEGTREWSIDVGGLRQASAMGAGWSVPEAFETPDGRVRFAWIEGEVASLRFASAGLEGGVVTLEAAAHPELAPLSVEIEVDGGEPALLQVPDGWNVVSAPIGSLAPGVHRLVIRAERAAATGGGRVVSLAVSGVAVSSAAVPLPSRDRGAFEGVVAAGLSPRPALYESAGSGITTALPECAVAPGFSVRCAKARPSRPTLEIFHGWITALLVLLAPGLAWTAGGRALGAARISLALAASVAVLVGSLVVLRLAGLEPTPVSLVVVLMVGTLPAYARQRDAPPLQLAWSWLAPAAIALVAFTWFAVAIVPPLEDQDMEVQVTAFGLAHEQAPVALTNRGRGYFFAHPPLLHFWVAGSETLHGRLSRLEPHATAAARPLEGGSAAARRGWTELLWLFFQRADLWPVRSVNVVLGALAVGLVATLVTRSAGTIAAGVALALVFASFPETLVRSGYGGYFAGTAALSLLVLASIGEGKGAGRGVTGGSALLFLVNQKGLLVPVAHALSLARRPRLTPALLGAAIGLAAFVGWGLAIDADSFVTDFAREHVADRLLTGLLVADAGYPTLASLWREFGAHFGWVFTGVGLVASVSALRGPDPVARAAGAAVLLGALVFSATDWRQTKHLALLVPLAMVPIGAAWPRRRGARHAALLVCLAIVLRNVWVAAPLIDDFLALRPSPIW